MPPTGQRMGFIADACSDNSPPRAAIAAPRRLRRCQGELAPAREEAHVIEVYIYHMIRIGPFPRWG